MKFPAFKEFSTRFAGLDEVIKYLRVEHTLNLKELITGLRNLTFADNFQSFEVEVDIPATSEVAIANQFKGVIPSKRIIVKANVNTVVDGDNAWTTSYLYLKNTGATAATVKVLFLK